MQICLFRMILNNNIGKKKRLPIGNLNFLVLDSVLNAPDFNFNDFR